MDDQAVCDLFVSYAEADRDWVEGYLLDAFTSAGVRAQTEAAFALGRPRLAAFEEAVTRSGRVLLILSRAYLADDTAALVDVLAQTYGQEIATWPVVPLLLEPVTPPTRLKMLVGVDASDPAQREQAVADLCARLRLPLPPPAGKPACPYPGMRPFNASEDSRFYGRTGEIADLLQRLHAQRDLTRRFLAVVGPSGSGKSSLVFAGLVPALWTSTLFGAGGWRVLALRPGAAPLAAATAVVGTDPAEIGLTVAELASAPPRGKLLLVVDQFEELFAVARRQAPGDEAPFQEALARLAATPDSYVVLTARADFYEDLMGSPLWPLIKGHRAEVLPLGEAGLREAIVRPSEGAGVYVEAALVERLAADAAGEPGVLPLVQQTLVLLWERLERRFLPLRAYEALVLPRLAYGEAGATETAGRTGLQVAVARHADAVLAELSPEWQAIASRILLRLVQFGEGRADTRRQRSVAELRSVGDDPALFEATLRHLAANRLLTLGAEVSRRGDGGAEAAEVRVDLAHEALIAGWPWLQQLVAEQREAEQARQRLDAKAAEWVRLGRGQGGLLDEAELAEAERWLASAAASELGFGEALPDLVRRSREEQAREVRRLRTRLAVAVVFAVLAFLAAAAALLALGQARDREQEAMAAQARAVAEATRADAERERADRVATDARAGELAAQALRELPARPDLAWLLGIEASTTADTAATRSSLLSGLIADPHLVAFLRGHVGEAWSVAFDEVGRTIATVGCEERDADGECTAPGVRLWDASTDRQIDVLVPSLVGSVARSPDGHLLAWTFTEDGEVGVWDLTEGKILIPPSISPDDWDLDAVSPDGRLAAYTGCSEPSPNGCTVDAIRLWDLATDQPHGPLLTPSVGVDLLTFSADGKTLAGAGNAGMMAWDAVTGQPLGPPITEEYGYSYTVSLALSMDGTVLATGNANGELSLWDVASGQRLSQLLGASTDLVSSLAFSPDGTILASGSDVGPVTLWSLDDGERLDDPMQGHQGSVVALDFSPDGSMLASIGADGVAIRWTVEPQQRLAQSFAADPSVLCVAYSPEQNEIAVATWDGGGATNTRDLVFSPDHPGTGLIALREATTGREIDKIPLAGEVAVTSLAFSPDGGLLASGTDQGTILLWDTADLQQRGPPLSTQSDGIATLAFSPDGRTLAAGSWGGKVSLWDVETGRSLGPALDGHDDVVSAVVFSSDGATLASGSWDGTIVLWDVGRREQRSMPLGGGGRGVASIAFSPDDRNIAAGTERGEVMVLDVATGREVARLPTGDEAPVYGIAYAPDGKTLVSGSANLVVWDVESRQPLGTLLTSPLTSADELNGYDLVRFVAFGRDGEQLATARGDGTVMLWDLDAESWRSRSCELAGRNLTRAEWERFFPNEPYRPTCPSWPSDEGAPNGAISAGTPTAAESP